MAQAGQAILVGPTYADVLRCLPRADGAMRRAQWGRVVAAAPADPAPYLFDFAGAFSLAGTERDGSVLGGGWHEAEPWGRWTDGVEASLRVVFAAPVAELLRLELDLNPSPVGARLTLCIDGTKLPVVHPVPGLNVWAIPPALVMGKTGFTLKLLVDEAVCPAALGKSPDTRILGIGVSAVRLRSRQPTVCRLGAYFPINGDAAPREVLVEGWHAPEPWGCWSNGAAGSLRLWLDAPLTRPVQLELDLVATPAEAVLAVFVNGWTSPSASLRDGTGWWGCRCRRRIVRRRLMVPRTIGRWALACAACGCVWLIRRYWRSAPLYGWAPGPNWTMFCWAGGTLLSRGGAGQACRRLRSGCGSARLWLGRSGWRSSFRCLRFVLC